MLAKKTQERAKLALEFIGTLVGAVWTIRVGIGQVAAVVGGVFVIDILHVLCTFGFAVHASLVRRRRVELGALANAAYEDFLKYWKYLWVVWLGMYLIYCLGHLGKYGHPFPQAWLNAILNAVNNAQAIIFLRLYLCLSNVSRPRLDGGVLWSVLAILVAFDLSALQVDNLQVFSASVSGVLDAVALSLFAGRLESKYIETNPLFLVLLFIYAGIQVFFPLLRTPPAFDNVPGVEALLMGFKGYALVMKVMLYFVVQRFLARNDIAFMIWKLHDADDLASARVNFQEQVLSD